MEELWDGGIIRGPYNSSETAISNENKIAQQEGFINDLELKEIVADENLDIDTFKEKVAYTRKSGFQQNQYNLERYNRTDDEIAEEERAEAIARYNARKRGETVESGGDYSPDYKEYQSLGNGKYVFVERDPLKGGKGSVNRNMNTSWYYAHMVAGSLAGAIYAFTGVIPLALVVGGFISLVSTGWLLYQKGRSMWYLLLLVVPFGWVKLLTLSDQD